ncbi:Scr1 family TA system antitoxin-like transcriptional regulator [Kitasatospora sp. NPDC096147]|uniref:Scr1 family TA system antitoxin-like transcriptional regulator n=1 Tax=Kitasatospora sp. NPDC096147 TaxID=3364093 RepID=UPI00382469E0
MSTRDYLFLNDPRTLAEIARWIAAVLGTPDPDLGSNPAEPQGFGRVGEFEIGFAVGTNYLRDGDERTAFNPSGVMVQPWALASRHDQQPAAKALFERLAADPAAPAMLLTEETGWVRAAHLPGKGTHHFPQGTGIEDVAAWQEWVGPDPYWPPGTTPPEEVPEQDWRYSTRGPGELVMGLYLRHLRESLGLTLDQMPARVAARPEPAFELERPDRFARLEAGQVIYNARAGNLPVLLEAYGLARGPLRDDVSDVVVERMLRDVDWDRTLADAGPGWAHRHALVEAAAVKATIFVTTPLAPSLTCDAFEREVAYDLPGPGAPGPATVIETQCAACRMVHFGQIGDAVQHTDYRLHLAGQRRETMAALAAAPAADGSPALTLLVHESALALDHGRPDIHREVMQGLAALAEQPGTRLLVVRPEGGWHTLGPYRALLDLPGGDRLAVASRAASTTYSTYQLDAEQARFDQITADGEAAAESLVMLHRAAEGRYSL